MSTLWQRDRDSVWAMNCRSRLNRGRRPEIGARWQMYGRLVTVSQPNLPWGHSTAKTTPRSVSHLADRVLLVWRKGQLVGGQVIWLCGSVTETFCLTADPQRCRLCPMCLLRAGAGPTIQINISVGQLIDGLAGPD